MKQIENSGSDRADATHDSALFGHPWDFYDKAPVACLVLDDTGAILHANPRASILLGTGLPDLPGRLFSGFVHAEHQETFLDCYRSLIETGACPSFDLQMIKHPAETFWASVSASLDRDRQNRPIGYLVLTDISERKTSEIQLEKNLARHHDLLDLAVDGVLLGDHEGMITQANQCMCSLLGLPRESFLGCHISTVRFTQESLARFPLRFDLLHKGETVVRERVIVRPDGTEVPVEIRTKMMPDGTYQSLFHDITERKKTERALEENEHFLRESQRAAHIGSYATDLETRAWKASEELYRIFGVDETYPHDLNGWATLIHPESREDLFAYHLEVETEKKRFDKEYRIIRPGTGEVRWVHGLGELEFDADMKPVRMTGTIQDITDRKLAETALRDNEETYRTIFENTGTSVILIEEDMTISRANGQFIRFTGLLPEQVVGRMKWTDFAHPGDIDSMAEKHRKRREGRDMGLTTYEIRFKNRSGETRYALINVKLVPGTKRSVASIIDITRRKEAETKLSASEEKFRTLAESSPIGIMLHQGDLWIYANKAATEICGYSEEELVTMPYWGFAHPDFKDLVRETGQKRQKGDKRVPTAYEFKIICKNGEEKWVSITGSRIQYEDQPTAIIAAMDVTERKTSEEEKARLEHQLQQAQKMESIGRLAGGVAHDFNNMLGVILGHADLALMATCPDQPLYGNLAEIRKASERSAGLTRQLLAFARKQTISPKILDMNETVEGMLKMLRRLIGEDIHLVWQPGPGLWPVKMDPSQIDQILVNLCVNARDAIGGVGKMTIETGNCSLDESYAATHAGFLSGDYVKIAISDNGCGMDRETLSHIFEPFYTTKGVNQGTGLGLATVYGAIKQNNGFINAYSEPDSGSTFTLYLPRYLGKEERFRKKTPVEVTARGHETILLVEDEPAILEVTTLLLERHGYTVLTAGTPGEAIDLAEKHAGEIHLLLTDVVMPEMNGRELAKNLLSLYPDLKRLFMSGYTANVIAHHGVLDEGVHFIQKPFSFKDLTNRLREALNGD